MANRVKTVFKRADGYKDLFKYSHCLLSVSVGQQYHEDELFESTINLINDSFASCTISLYDSLQRHTMALNSPKEPEYFHDIAAIEGKLWLERNEKYYSKLKTLKKIVRWDQWLNHSDFISQQKKITSLINEDSSYANVFVTTIDSYLTKYQSRLNDPSNFDINRAKRICFNYIVEECTVLCLWPELECQFEIYPNKHNDAMEETRRCLIHINHPNILQAVQITFRGAKQAKPQSFALLNSNELLVAN
jgi:hypothetical protein